MSLLCLGFIAQYAFDILPCSLCIYERYVMGVAAFFCAIVCVTALTHKILRLLILLTVFTGLGLSFFHIGVEQKWWEMPASCVQPVKLKAKTPEELMQSVQSMQNKIVPPCNEVNWRLFSVPATWWTAFAFSMLTLAIGLREWMFRKQ